MPKIIDNPEEIILQYARSIVLQEGYDSLTMRKVSIQSGIAVGTIYNYFPTKNSLTIRLMEDYWYDYLKAVDEIDEQESDLYSKLFHIYRKLEDFYQTFREVWVKNNSARYPEDSLVRKQSFIQKLEKRLEKILVDAQYEGSIVLSLPSSIVAEFLLLNFFTMAQMKHFEYTNFEQILKNLFSH